MLSSFFKLRKTRYILNVDCDTESIRYGILLGLKKFKTGEYGIQNGMNRTSFELAIVEQGYDQVSLPL